MRKKAEIKIKKREFEKFVKAIAKVSNIAKIKADETNQHLECVTIDPRAISLLKCIVPCEVKGSTTFMLEVKTAPIWLRTVKDDLLEMEVENEKIRINNWIEVKLLNSPPIEEPEIPEFEFTARTDDIDLRKLRKITRAGKILSPDIKFIAEDGILTVRMEPYEGVLNFGVCAVEGEGVASYPTDELDRLLDGLRVGKLAFGTHSPLKLESYEKGFYVMGLLANLVE